MKHIMNIFSTQGINSTEDALKLIQQVKNSQDELLIKIRNAPYFINALALDYDPEHVGFAIGEMYDEYVPFDKVVALAVLDDFSHLDF